MIYQKLPTLLATFLLLNGVLTAEEPTKEQTEASIDAHVPIGSRRVNSPSREAAQNSQAERQEMEDSTSASAMQENIKKAVNTSSNSEFMLAPRHMQSPQLSLTTSWSRPRYQSPLADHWLVGISDTQTSIEMEDGTHWKISPADSYLMRDWRRDDSLVVMPNYGWLNQYDYYVTNTVTGTYVKASMYVGPLAFGPKSHWIIEIDRFGNHVFLENNMVWCVNSQDAYLIRDWAVNDHVILGLYDSLFSSYDHILINVNMDNHVRVKQY